MTNKRGQVYKGNVRHAHLFLRRHFGSRTTVIPSPRGPDLSFSRQDGGNDTNPAGLSPCILPRECKSSPMPPSRAKNGRQKSANPALFPRMSPGSTPEMAADKCIRTAENASFVCSKLKTDIRSTIIK